MRQPYIESATALSDNPAYVNVVPETNVQGVNINQLIEVQYNDVNIQWANITSSIKLHNTKCTWSFLLLHNTVGGVLWAGETRARCFASF